MVKIGVKWEDAAITTVGVVVIPKCLELEEQYV